MGAVPVDDHMVLAAGTTPVDRRGPGVSPPLRARTCEPSTATSSISSMPAARSCASSISCSRGHTPASVHSRNLRQQVTPLHPIFSAGTSRQATLVRRTKMMPASATRSSTGLRPGYRYRRADLGGSSGATRAHRSSGTRSTGTRDTVPETVLERHLPRRTHSETISKGSRVLRGPRHRPAPGTAGAQGRPGRDRRYGGSGRRHRDRLREARPGDRVGAAGAAGSRRRPTRGVVAAHDRRRCGDPSRTRPGRSRGGDRRRIRRPRGRHRRGETGSGGHRRRGGRPHPRPRRRRSAVGLRDRTS